jgi:general secretion pathway protein J
MSMPRPGARGFTLIEVMLALAIFSVILAALYGTFFLAHKAVDGLDDSLLRMHELRTAFDTMQRELEAATAGTENPFVVRDRDIYGKDASQLTLTTLASPSPGLLRVSYYVADQDGSLVLYKRLLPAYGQEEQAPSDMEAPVLEDIEGFTVEIKRGNTWTKTWDDSKPPEEMRLTISLRIQQRDFTMSETIRPKIGSTVGGTT